MAKASFKLSKSSYPSPQDVYQTKLSNGITVLVRSNFNSPSISMGGYLPAGAIFESDEKLGLADFVSTSLMRGTQTLTFDQIYNELESVGASLGFDSGVHNTNFGGRALVAAISASAPTDRIVVFGSFFTVGGVLQDGVPRLQARHV